MPIKHLVHIMKKISLSTLIYIYKHNRGLTKELTNRDLTEGKADLPF